MADGRAEHAALVVDDAEAKRYRLVTLLRRDGYRVLEAASGAEAMAVLGEQPVDVVVLDVNLPDLSGFEVSAWLKSQPELAAIPVLHVSGTFTDVESRSAGLRQGADGYLVEPLEPIEFLATVGSLVRYASARRRSERLAATLSALHEGTLRLAEARDLDAFAAAALHGAEAIFAGTMAVVFDLEDRSRIDLIRLGVASATTWHRPTLAQELAHLAAGDRQAAVPVELDGATLPDPLSTLGDRLMVAPSRSRSGLAVGAVITPANPDTSPIVLAQFAQAMGIAFENLRSAARARALAALGRRLNDCSSTDEVVHAVTNGAAGVIGARHVVLGLVSPKDADTIEVLLPAEMPATIGDRYLRLPRSDDAQLCVAIRRGEAVVDLDPTSVAVSPALQADRVRLGVGAVAAIPLISGGAPPFGAIALTWSDPAYVDDEMMTQATILADMCARAVTQARATEAREVQARRSEGLANLAQARACARTAQQVAAVVGDLAPSVVGADTAHLVLQATSADEPDGPAPLDDEGPLRQLPLVEVARSGRPRFLGQVVTLAPVSAPVGPRHDADGPVAGAVAMWPVAGGPGRSEPAAVLVYRWPGPVAVDEALRAVVATVAELCGQTLERARLYDAEHALIAELQRTAVHDIPGIAGVAVQAKYLPAGPLSQIGGDFYDSVRYDDQHIAIVVGDVTGHGIEAAAHMIQVRTKLHTLLSTGAGLGDVFTLADRALAGREDLIVATAVVLLIDTVRDELAWVTAGHPPLLLRRPDGSVERLDGARRSLLGVPAPRVIPRVVPFGPGSSVLAYTDGLFEQPEEPADVGIEGLAAAFGRTPDVDAIVGALRRSRVARDDIALVLATRR